MPIVIVMKFPPWARDLTIEKSTALKAEKATWHEKFRVHIAFHKTSKSQTRENRKWPDLVYNTILYIMAPTECDRSPQTNVEQNESLNNIFSMIPFT